MRPDQRWFPTNRVERAAWFNNFAVQFASVGLSLGFTQAEIDAVTADNAVVQFMARTVLATEAYTAAVLSFQRTLLGGKIGAATPQFPAAPVLNVPVITPTGIFERLERLVRRIRVQPAYTPEAGALLGIIPRQAYRFAISELVPTFKASPLNRAYSFEVKVTKRLFKAFFVEFQRSSSNDWEKGGFFTSSPAIVTIEPANPGVPELLRVRVRMVKNNDAVGLNSDIQIVTVIPQ
jgi:hypothetical protein